MAELKVDILTLFPEMFDAVLKNSIIGRAVNNGILEINCVQIRDYAFNKHRQVDDYPYGGGQGMVMQAEPIFLAYESVCEGLDYKPFTIYMSPQGRTFRQSTAKRFARKKHIVILCGHYEGVDQRVLDEIIDAEVSMGDFVLTGGEIPACILVDSVARLVDGVLAAPECYLDESITGGLLEYPQYTRPYEFHGVTVPDVLISGHHENIDKWRKERSIELTKERRPDLLEKYERR